MPSPDRLRAPKNRDANPLLAGVLLPALTLVPSHINLSPPPNCPNSQEIQNALTTTFDKTEYPFLNCELIVRKPDQKIMISGYGHREKDQIMNNGNIKDGFEPVNGSEYGEADLQKAFEILRTLKYAHIDGIAWSWHHIDTSVNDEQRDWRDKFIFWWANTVMEDPRNPYKEALFSIIYERHSNEDRTSWQTLIEDHAHLQSIFENEHFWKNEKGISQYFVFSQENELWNFNFDYFDSTYLAATAVGAEPIFQDFFGSELLNGRGKYQTFSYGFPIWDWNPNGVHITDDNVRVTIAYEKKHAEDQEMDDIKVVVFDKKLLLERIQTAINSGRNVLINSLNEWWESSELLERKEAIEVFHDAIPILPTKIPTATSGDQFIDFVSDFIKSKQISEIPDPLPPAQPKEIPVFVLEARRKKEDLEKPILRPNFKPRSKSFSQAS